jgi:hypothetical protein
LRASNVKRFWQRFQKLQILFLAVRSVRRLPVSLVDHIQTDVTLNSLASSSQFSSDVNGNQEEQEQQNGTDQNQNDQHQVLVVVRAEDGSGRRVVIFVC